MRAGVYEARKRTPRPSVVYGGDGARGKKVAASLIRDAGFEPGRYRTVAHGPLRSRSRSSWESWRTEGAAAPRSRTGSNGSASRDELMRAMVAGIV